MLDAVVAYLPSPLDKGAVTGHVPGKPDELVSREPESVLPFEDAEPSIRRRVILEKKKETASWQAEQIAGEIREGASLDEVEDRHGLSVGSSEPFTRNDFVPGLGQANSATGAAFALEPGAIAGPIEADGRFYFIELVERIAPDREQFELQKEQVRAQLTQQRRQVALDEWIADLRAEADIEDWRDDFFLPGS